MLLGDVDAGQAVADPAAQPSDVMTEVLGQMIVLLETLDERAR
jgi:hypothetical protein